MKTTARVILTYDCNRKCPGCCNKSYQGEIKIIDNHSPLFSYQEIVLTGGEPMLYPTEILKLITLIREGFNGNIFMYTSYWKPHNKNQYSVISALDGITFTLHAECNDEDIVALKDLSYEICSGKNNRLFIDNRVYDKYDLLNIDLSKWRVIRKLQWKEKCEPALNEDLLYFDIKRLFRKE